MQRRNRTAKMTIDDLFTSPRLKIAIESFPFDQMLLKAIFVEIVGEAMQVAKNTVIKQYAKHSTFNQQTMLPFLRNISDFTSWNLHWSLSPLESRIYCTDPQWKLPSDEREKLIKKLHKQFMESKS